ncbi:hypothetical protein HOY82DRAFT_540036 [Tuber indicum]|nr:hypothetical protein HOY82DRAFT_540036 [Tuber indicum]
MRLYEAELFLLLFLLLLFFPFDLICSAISTNLLLLTSFNLGQIHETTLSYSITLPERMSLPTAHARAHARGVGERKGSNLSKDRGMMEDGGVGQVSEGALDRAAESAGLASGK